MHIQGTGKCQGRHSLAAVVNEVSCSFYFRLAVRETVPSGLQLAIQPTPPECGQVSRGLCSMVKCSYGGQVAIFAAWTISQRMTATPFCTSRTLPFPWRAPLCFLKWIWSAVFSRFLCTRRMCPRPWLLPCSGFLSSCACLLALKGQRRLFKGW